MVARPRSGGWLLVCGRPPIRVGCGKRRNASWGERGLIHMNAWTMRGTNGYEWAMRRLRALQIRPIWDPKKESEEDFAKRLASWMKGMQWIYSPQGIEKVVFDEFVPEKDEKINRMIGDCGNGSKTIFVVYNFERMSSEQCLYLHWKAIKRAGGWAPAFQMPVGGVPPKKQKVG